MQRRPRHQQRFDPGAGPGHRAGSIGPRRLATAAAVLLLAASLFIPAPGGAAWPFRRDSLPELGGPLGEAAARVLAAAIRQRTVSPPGDERPLAELYVALLEREGIEAKVVPTPSEGSEVGRAAAWARLPGTGARRPVVLLSHLDVVPAEDAEWAVDPFEGVVGGGYVVGRGALDAKGVGVVQLFTLLELKRRGIRLDRDVIFLATPDEETGGRAGAGWIVREARGLLRDAEYLLTEGGSILPGEGARPDVWGVAFAEKSPCWLEVVARGTPGHGSAAAADAAVPKLVGALDRVRRMEMETRVVPEVATMFAALAPLAVPEEQRLLGDLATALAAAPDFRDRFLGERGRAALVRDTLTITVLRGSERTNVVPAEASAHLDVRLLPGGSCDAFANRVRRVIDDETVMVRTLLTFSSQSAPLDTELYRAIEAAAAESGRPAVVTPRVIAGFTDSHWFRDVGIVAYGFVPRWLRPHETRGVHGPNERVSLENLERGAETLVRILEHLAGAEAAR